ncbi:MAG: OsmC family protein [Nitrospirota bacterium]
MAVRTSTAVWNGTLKEGNGNMTVGSGAYNGPFSFASRFESAGGTNPEELIAAASAGCFSMALSAGLGKNGFTATKVSTTAKAYLEKVGEGFGITKIELTCEAQVPGIDDAKFAEIAEGTRTGCPVSKALAGVEIALTTKLIN